VINIGVVGCGYWGPNLIRNFSEGPETGVVAVADLDERRLQRIKARYPAVEITTDYGALLRNSAIDAIAVATPVATHYDLALQALRAGKHVFIEKPLTETAEQAERLIAEADRRGLVLHVDHTFVYTGAVRKIRELVDRNELGELYYYDSVRINLGLFQSDVSVIWDLAVHDLSIMDYVFGTDPVAVSTTGQRHVEGSPENIAFLTLFFANNAIAHLHVNWLAPVKVRRTLIGGSRKMIVYDDLEPSEKIKVYDKGISLNGSKESLYKALIDYRAGDMWAPQLEVTEALRVEARHFVRCVAEGEASPSDGRAGLRVVRILEAATRSLNERGRPVKLDMI
jgi:predicted dehydrogenase